MLQSMDDPLHLEEFAAAGFTQCRMLLPALPHDQVAAVQLASSYLDGPHRRAAFSCAECGGPPHSVKPWRLEDVLGKPLGRLT